MPTRVKICGITRPEDAALAAEYGADYIGLNFFRGPRQIDFARGDAILNELPTRIEAVGLVAHDRQRSCLQRLALQQVYGLLDNPTAADAIPGTYSRVWLPVPVDSRDAITRLHHQLERSNLHVGAILLDTASATMLGGTGHAFNWRWIAEARDAGELASLPPIILAGGLTPDNVADAIRIAQPYAVDVSSGVEVPGKPGIKDPGKLRDFLQAAKGL